MSIESSARKAATEMFEELKREVLKVDPVSFCEQYLKVDGVPLRLDNTGWRFLSDIYRHMGTNAIRKDSKPTVIVKGRQVGATTMACALEMYFMTSGLFGSSHSYPPVRVLHCFPSLKNVSKYVKSKLSSTMRTSTDDYISKQALSYDEKTGKKRGNVPDDTQDMKFFKNENQLWIDSNGNNASRLQGMTLDMIFHDEVQRMLKDDINNGIRTLTAANYGKPTKGVQLYFGTPLFKGSYFWKLWHSSDQRYYHLKCTKCEKFFLLYTPGSDEWEEIWIEGNILKCPHCSHLQTKLDAVLGGKWIPTKKQMDNGGEPLYTGFHFNQFLLPRATKELINSENPKYNPTKSVKIWQTDILGEFYSGSAVPMTEDEIHTYCKDAKRTTRSSVLDGEIITVAGADWGKKTDTVEDMEEGQSYSSIVICSILPNKYLQIEKAFMLKKNDQKYKIAVVDQVFRRYMINMMVADIGYGNDLVPILQNKYQNKVWACTNSGTLIRPVKLIEDSLTIVCNKDLMLDDVFNSMRAGRIRFPLGDSKSFEEINWLIEHCCSMELETRTVAGNVVNKYVKGNSPNDGLMSLLYAFIAARFILTHGFSVQKHREGRGMAKPVLAHLPKL